MQPNPSADPNAVEGLQEVQLADVDGEDAPRPKARTMHTFTAAAGGAGLVFGGRMSPARPLGDSWLWHPQQQQWEQLQGDGPPAR